MKIWISKTTTPTHLFVKLHCEKHSDFQYLGDLEESELIEFFLSLDTTIDTQKNIKLLNYYGYLHLFIKKQIPNQETSKQDLTQ